VYIVAFFKVVQQQNYR